MATLSRLYGHSLALLTDLYQVTMAYAYWKSGTHTREAAFHLFFRRNPFRGGFSVACGLEEAIEYLQGFRFQGDDLAYLGDLRGNDGEPLFDDAFLRYLADMTFHCDVDAIPEGTVVFPQEPLLRVTGPIAQCQLLETPLLNLVNFQTLIATKAARVCLAADGDPVIEFGLRRAQGIDGAMAASRAAYVGGCVATSNLLAGKMLGIPVRGTHAHSWVLSWESELEAFMAYAAALPNNCVFLVDTYDTLEGVRNAARVGSWLRERGHEMAGIRLDSGDLAWLSVEARKILDEAGFPKASVTASNDLDEHLIESLKIQGAQIRVWGVGTRLVTGYDDPALGGVYKLTAVRDAGGAWQPKVKVSEQAVKTTTPGIQQVRRFTDGHEFMADMIFDETHGAPAAPLLVDPTDMTRRKEILAGTASADLLVPVFRHGERVYDPPPLADVRRRAQEQIAGFHAGVKRFVNPHRYPVGLEQGLFDLKTRLVLEARGLAKA
ncbi:MAG TPA: nicotinate phosphoribosyltransferase [Thermoanaerobaculia bacterium]|nr:nicotinate phosphoribosyltransferase [Thermoanaerobaculia bacterium]